MAKKIRLTEAKKFINQRLVEPNFDLQGLASAEVEGLKTGRDIPTPYIDTVIKNSPGSESIQLSINISKRILQGNNKIFNDTCHLTKIMLQLKEDIIEAAANAANPTNADINAQNEQK